jgi:hypothetical protein
VKDGTLVELSWPVTIGACELLGSCEALPLDLDRLPLLEETDTGVNVCEGVGAVCEGVGAVCEGVGAVCEGVGARPKLCWLEDGAAGACVGVMKEVERMVSALFVANGFPFTSENVTAGMI